MRQSTIARNYAEALLELARRAKDLRGWGTLIQSVADSIARDPKVRAFLETPRVDAATKNAVFRKALSDTAPSKFVRFIESVVTHRRQMLFPEIAQEYMDLVDQAENRMHATVTVARARREDEEAHHRSSLEGIQQDGGAPRHCGRAHPWWYRGARG